MRQFQAAAIFVVVSVLASAGQQASDPIATLLRTRQRLLADLARMPRYTCVQTITRKYYDSPSRFGQTSCAKLISQHQARKHELSVVGWDRLRLDVALVEGSNAFAWVGAPRFADDTFEQLAGRGPLGSGDFGTFLTEIFLKAKATFQREDVNDGKRLLEYSYDMPVGKSAYKVKTRDNWTVTAYSGTLLLDPEAMDIVGLTARTAELPEESAACQAISEVGYGRTSIHGRMVLIPRETRLRAIYRSGAESLSVTGFASCREYASTIRILLDDSQAAETGATPAAAAQPPETVPAGIHFKTRIVTPIDSDNAAAGDPIELILRSPMRDKKRSVLAPVGTRLHGRLLRLEQRSTPTSHFEVAVQLESLEIGGRSVAFHSTSYPVRLYVPIQDPRRPRQAEFVDPWNSATFYFPEKHLRLKDLESEWVTVSADQVKEAAETLKKKK